MSDERVSDGGTVAGRDAFWYRGVVQYNGGPPVGYVVTTPQTAALEYVWHGREHLADDPAADCCWIERRPMDCWERISCNVKEPAELTGSLERGLD